MKKHIRLLSVLAMVLVLSAPMTSFAQDGRKQRLINKNYTVTPDDKLMIENQFGNVVVSTWDKNEIVVDIEISAKASSEEKAQDIMNKIDVKDGKDGHTVWFKTKVGEIHNGNGRRGRDDDGHNDQRSFYIDYVVHMPAVNRLEIENSFGKTEIPAYKGLVTLTSKFGSLNTGKLENVDQIDVEFGKANIGAVNNGRVVFKFNKESRIGDVNGNVKITSEFSQNVQVNVADNIQDLALSESYSGVRMVVNKEISAQFDVHTSFGHFRNECDFNIKEQGGDDPGPKFDKDYSGQAGDGKARIRIKSSFGNVRLAYVGDKGRDNDDDGDEDRDKHKTKNKSKDKEKDKDTDGDNEVN